MASRSDYIGILNLIAANLDTADVKSAKFLIGVNRQLFPASELEAVDSGYGLMELMRKKGFVSESNVTDLYSLLQDIKCGQLLEFLEPLRRKQTVIEDANWKIGYSAVPHFVKVQKCDELKQALTEENIVLLRGPPASGKTQLACHYAEEFYKCNTKAVIWKLDCEGKTELVKSMIDLLERMHMKPEGRNEGKARYIEELGQMILDNLNSKCRLNYIHLLIFDDIGESCNGSVSKILRRFKENAVNVKVIATLVEDIDVQCKTIKVTGLDDDEVIQFFKSNINPEEIEESAALAANEGEIRTLARLFGNSPFGLMISKMYMQKTSMDIVEYTKNLRKYKTFIDDTEKLEGNIGQYYKKRLLVAHDVVLKRIELKLSEHGKVLLSYLPFLHHENISVKVLTKLLESALFHGHTDYEACNVIHRLKKFSLCVVKGLGPGRVLSIHALTRRAIWNRLSTEQRDEHIDELLQFFATNMSMDCRLQVNMETNMLFIDHAMNLLRLANEMGKPSIKTQVLTCYVSALVGVTFRIGGVDNFLVNDYLTKARDICFQITELDYSNFERNLILESSNHQTGVCTSTSQLGSPGEGQYVKPSHVAADSFIEEKDTEHRSRYEKHVDELANKLIDVMKGNIREEFIKDILTTMMRSKIVMEHLKLRSQGLSRFSFDGQLETDVYDELVIQELAMPTKIVRDFFLLELLIVILYNHGRNHYLSTECRQESMQLSLVLGIQLRAKCSEFLPVQCLITQRNGLWYKLLKDERFKESEEQQVRALETAARQYVELLHEKQDYFEFGVLKVSQASKNFHHTSMCLKFLIKCHCRLFALRCSEEDKKAEYDFGLKYVEKLIFLAKEMEEWVSLPGLHIQVAKFYMLLAQDKSNMETPQEREDKTNMETPQEREDKSNMETPQEREDKSNMETPQERGDKSNMEKAIHHLSIADDIEEKTTKEGLSHFRLQALFGLINCYKKAGDKESLQKASSKCGVLINNLHLSNSQGSFKKANTVFEEICELLREEDMEL